MIGSESNFTRIMPFALDFALDFAARSHLSLGTP